MITHVGASIRLQMGRIKSHSLRYGSALLITFLAIGCRAWFSDSLGKSGFAVFLIGMLASAWVGGLGPSLICQTMILFAEALLFDPINKPHSPMTFQGMVSLAAFYSVGSIVALLSEARTASLKRILAQQREVHDQREQLRATFACIGDGVVVTDNEGKITLINPVAEKMTGWSLAECAGNPVSEIFVVKDDKLSERVVAPVALVLESGEIQHETMNWLLTTREGSLLPVSFSAAPIFNADSEATGVVLIFSDQSERCRIMNELQLANKRKDEFLATLAHELRNPLAPISMGVDLLKMTLDDHDELDEVVDTMERQTKHMVRLIDDLLDVSRITRGKVELRKTDIALTDVVREAVEATRPLMQSASHELHVSLPEQPIIINADPSRLNQILSNLLNNAAKYTPAGGRIELVVERSQDHVAITVKDNGVGISIENQQVVFDMFMQARSAMENGQKGLGIGLTLVKRLVEMHAGQVEVHSDGVNRGSCFRVLLPGVSSDPVVETSRPVSSLPAKAIRQGRILIVDDNEDALGLLSMLVKNQGHLVCLARDGVEAVEKAASFHPQVILMDIGMPRLNGYDAARRIRQQPGGKDIALVATTGWGQTDDRLRTSEAGFDHHLVKPVDNDVLHELLSKLCSHPIESQPVHNKRMAFSL